MNPRMRGAPSERQQRVGLGPRAGVFAQRCAERGVADLAMGGESWRVGGEKGGRPLGVLTVFNEMESVSSPFLPDRRRQADSTSTPKCAGSRSSLSI